MLSYRLNEIVKLCGRAKRVADVGCDHGKVLAELAKKKTTQFLIASDISAPSVEKAKVLLESLNYKNFSVRVGDGCKTLTESDNLDLVVIAGMGGFEIIEILKASPINLNNLVLQPQNNVVKLRQYLLDNNFYIITDKVVQDKGKFYNILKVKKTETKQHLSERAIKFGKSNLVDYNPEFVLMLKAENEKLANRLSGIKNVELRDDIMQKIINNNKEIDRANNRR
ncbi:MAG: SAM-dependent methyltransferase [Clostridia bacterium]|nr:SAM-dependent methyltransferase [Clostridia bacterium]